MKKSFFTPGEGSAEGLGKDVTGKETKGCQGWVCYTNSANSAGPGINPSLSRSALTVTVKGITISLLPEDENLRTVKKLRAG